MKVRYNGNKKYGYAGFGIVELLKPNEVYEVKYIRVHPSLTELVLKEIDTKGTRYEGLELSDFDYSFNSCWFDGVCDSDGNIMAYTNCKPVVGAPMNCYRLDLNSEDYFIAVTTKPVREISRVPKALSNIYHVVTTDGRNYMVDVH